MCVCIMYMLCISKTREGNRFRNAFPGLTPHRCGTTRAFIYTLLADRCARRTHTHTSTQARTRGETHRRRQSMGGHNGRSAAPPHRVRALYNMTIPPLQIAIVTGVRGKIAKTPFVSGIYII